MLILVRVRLDHHRYLYKSLGVVFWRSIKNSREILFSTRELCERERDLLITLVFSTPFSIKISPLLPVDVGTLPNQVKYRVPWLCGNYLLVVDLLCFRFLCRVFNSVFLYCLIGDKSSTIGIRVMASKMTMTTKFVTPRFPKYMETESRRRSAMYVREKNTHAHTLSLK